MDKVPPRCHVRELCPRAQWLPDASAPTCAVCRAKFSVVRRRHHCRQCGRVVCATCSGGTATLADPAKGGAEAPKQRCCSQCQLASDPTFCRITCDSLPAFCRQLSGHTTGGVTGSGEYVAGVTEAPSDLPPGAPDTAEWARGEAELTAAHRGNSFGA